MSGISSVLNIAKEALLAHQLSVQVASHNVANVDTPGYTRQTLSLGTNLSTPTSVGSLGGGVRGVLIARQYDQFMTQRIMNQQSTLGNLEAQQESLRVVETIFNEAPGMALNDLMSQFWASLQELADNPELLASRQAVVQKGELLQAQFQTMNSEITQTRYNLSMNLDTAISDVNSLSSQIAELNVDITSSEGEHSQANDLRDQRDELVKELSQLVDITYFENKAGAYTVLLTDGHSLVDTNESWKVQWANNSLSWVGTGKDGREVSATLGSGSELGGKIGGWLEVRGQLEEGDPDNFLGKLDALANSLIREVNQQHSQGVGTLLFSSELTGAETAANTAVLTTDKVTSPLTTIAAGTFEINGRTVGKIEGGSTMTKAANAVNAINEAITGVTAKLTTQVTGGAVSNSVNGDLISFMVNGVEVFYTVDTGNPNADTLLKDDTPENLAANLVNQINKAISADTTIPEITIAAKVDSDTNGNPVINLANSTGGDESRIIIGDITVTDAGGSAKANLTGLAAGTYTADPSHNTGAITLVSDQTFTIKAGTDDTFLEQLGMTAARLPTDDQANDGQFTFNYQDGNEGVEASLQGFKYADELQTDGGSFDIWLYNADGSLSLSQPVKVSLERAQTLYDVANSIKTALAEAGGQTSWLQASVVQNRLVLKPDASHQFAFANDSSNFLQVAGINTFFTGNSAGTLGVNETLAGNLKLLAAGQVGDRGEIFAGNNANALLITNIQRDENIRFTGGTTSTLDGFYNSLVAEIGTNGRTINRNYEFSSLVTTQLSELRDATSGVSLDEEMANLIKFQHAYSAAAKLISTSDEMLQSLLATVSR